MRKCMDFLSCVLRPASLTSNTLDVDVYTCCSRTVAAHTVFVTPGLSSCHVTKPQRPLTT